MAVGDKSRSLLGQWAHETIWCLWVLAKSITMCLVVAAFAGGLMPVAVIAYFLYFGTRLFVPMYSGLLAILVAAVFPIQALVALVMASAGKRVGFEVGLYRVIHWIEDRKLYNPFPDALKRREP